MRQERVQATDEGTESLADRLARLVGVTDYGGE
jgi:hypothetical protein